MTTTSFSDDTDEVNGNQSDPNFALNQNPAYGTNDSTAPAPEFEIDKNEAYDNPELCDLPKSSKSQANPDHSTMDTDSDTDSHYYY